MPRKSTITPVKKSKALLKLEQLVAKPRKDADDVSESESDADEQPEVKAEPVPEPKKSKAKKITMPSLSDDSDDEITIQVSKKPAKKSRAKPKASEKTPEKAPIEQASPAPEPQKIETLPPAKEPIVEAKVDPIPAPEVPKLNHFEEERIKFEENLKRMSDEFQKSLVAEKARFKEETEKERIALAREKAELSNMKALKYQSLLRF